jgi:hypothetical protein
VISFRSNVIDVRPSCSFPLTSITSTGRQKTFQTVVHTHRSLRILLVTSVAGLIKFLLLYVSSKCVLPLLHSIRTNDISAETTFRATRQKSFKRFCLPIDPTDDHIAGHMRLAAVRLSPTNRKISSRTGFDLTNSYIQQIINFKKQKTRD